MMLKRRIAVAGVVATLGALAVVATVAAAGPQNGGGLAAADALKLTRDQVQELRHEGLSLAQIAQRQGVPINDVVDALVARWTERIQVRLDNGALTAAEAKTLTAQVQERAQAMVRQTAPGGMQGVAVGAGPRNGVGPGDGSGSGTGTCDGTGPHGAGRS